MLAAPPTTWLRISEAFKIAIARFGSREKANYEMKMALRQGKIRNGGVLCLENGEDVAYRKIHIHTDDFMKWLNQDCPPN